MVSWSTVVTGPPGYKNLKVCDVEKIGSLAITAAKSPAAKARAEKWLSSARSYVIEARRNEDAKKADLSLSGLSPGVRKAATAMKFADSSIAFKVQNGTK